MLIALQSENPPAPSLSLISYTLNFLAEDETIRVSCYPPMEGVRFWPVTSIWPFCTEAVSRSYRENLAGEGVCKNGAVQLELEPAWQTVGLTPRVVEKCPCHNLQHSWVSHNRDALGSIQRHTSVRVGALCREKTRLLPAALVVQAVREMAA